jgi:NAD(P)-dependent dehydrogenase (short-subunit alcohol dehydrogenase family)
VVQSLAKELAPVRVNVVAPYYVDSPRRDAMESGARRALFDRVSSQLPIGFVAGRRTSPRRSSSDREHVPERGTIPVNGGALLQTIE